jgi:nitroreductase
VNLDNVIKGRRSIRKYKATDVPDSVIGQILDLARYTPSSMNGQPWHFIVVRDNVTKKLIAEVKNRHCPPEKRNYRADFIEDAPVLIVVCVNIEKSYGREIENGVLAAATIMLAAYSRGLGSVYLSAYNREKPELEEEIKGILSIPGDYKPVTIIPLGYPDEIPDEKKLKPQEEIVHYEKF